MGPSVARMLSERRGPDPAMVHVWAVYALLAHVFLWVWGAVLIALLLVATNLGLALTLLAVSLLIAASTSYAWAFLYHRFYRWQFADEQMHVWRGIMFRRRLTIPYMRIQNATVIQGPLLMLFGLCNVAVETAAAGQIAHGFSSPFGAYLPGVRNGEQVADAVIEAAKRAKLREGL